MNKGGFLILILSAVIAILITWLNSTWLNYKDFQLTKKVKEIDYYLSDFTLLHTKANGEMSHLLTGQHLIHLQATDTTEIFKPQLQTFDSDGIPIHLKSNKAVQDKNEQLTLTGNVNIHKKTENIADNFELITQYLVYNPIKKTLSSNVRVQLDTFQGRLTGIGFNTNLDEQELRIDSNVYTLFNPAK